MSGKVVVNRSMSLDGFIAGPGDAMDWIFDFVAPDAAWLMESAAATGAMLIGRRTDEVGSRMEADHATHDGASIAHHRRANPRGRCVRSNVRCCPEPARERHGGAGRVQCR